MVESHTIEARSLQVAMVGNVIMGIAGVSASYLSNSDALMIDGLYSMVNFASAIVAIKVARQVTQEPNPDFPYGYYANEALYVLFRSLVLLGILLFACFGALNKIMHYLNGGEVAEIKLGAIVIYSLLMVGICFGLAAVHHRNWLKTDKQSSILETERSAAIVDGFMSAGAGGALIGVTLLQGTFFDGIIPIADSILVLILCSTMLATPASLLRKSMHEIAGKASDSILVEQTENAIKLALENEAFEVIDFHMTKLGRSHFCMVHIYPNGAVNAQQLDAVRATVASVCDTHAGTNLSEVVFTAKKAF